MLTYFKNPDQILNDTRITNSAYRVWGKFRQKATIQGWIHHTSYIAKELGMNLKTVQKAVNNLIQYGYLDRTYDGIEPIYSIPVKYLCLKEDSDEAKKFYPQEEKSYAPKNYAPKSYAPKNGVHNNIDPNKKDLNKIDLNHLQEGNTKKDILNDEEMKNNFFEKEEEKNFEERRLQKITIKNLQKEHIDPLTTQNDDSYQKDKNLKIDTFSEGLSHESKNCESQDKEREILNDAEFMKFVMSKFPQVKNLHGYLKTPDKVTGKPVYEKIWAEFKGESKSFNESPLDSYWKQKLPYSSLQWEKDLPEYQIWLNRARNTKFDGSFTEDTTLGHSRNLRIYFINWYRYFYKDIDEQTLENDLPPVNPQLKNFVQTFCSNY